MNIKRPDIKQFILIINVANIIHHNDVEELRTLSILNIMTEQLLTPQDEIETYFK